MYLNKNISVLRKCHNLTQEGLAEKLRTNKKNITVWETGRAEPDIKTIKRLSEVFGVSADQMLKNEFVPTTYRYYDAIMFIHT